MANVSVLPNVVLLEQIAEEQVSSGGIILQETSASAMRTAITHVHPKTGEAYGVAVGDQVVVNPYSVREIRVDGAVRLAVTPGDILAKVGAADE